jgi:hypothetical protein
MSRRLMLMFDHPTCDVAVEIYVPLPEPIQEGTEAMADRYRPACPICKQPAQYLGWNFEPVDDADDDADDVLAAELEDL